MSRPLGAARLDGERGFTLVELLVTMLILSVVGMVLVNGLTQGMRSAARAQERAEALTELQLAMERMSRELRAADPLLSADEEEVEVQISRAGATRTVHYELDGGELVEQRTEGASTTSTVLAEDVDELELTYLDLNGTALDSPVTALELGQVVRVRVRITRLIQAPGAPIEVQTVLHLRNAT